MSKSTMTCTIPTLIRLKNISGFCSGERNFSMEISRRKTNSFSDVNYALKFYAKRTKNAVTQYTFNAIELM